MHLSRRHCLALLTLPMGLAAPAQAGLHTPWPRHRSTPPITLPQTGGTPQSLAALRGRPVLLNFWASWCEPCRAEMPSLELLAARHEADGLVVLAVNHRETDGTVERFVTATGLSLPVVRDRDGAAAMAFGVRVFPTTVAIGRDGRARFSVVGEVDWQGADARRWLEPLVAPAGR
jgi:thiol-disulfide isomerase/thioredoxin